MILLVICESSCRDHCTTIFVIQHTSKSLVLRKNETHELQLVRNILPPCTVKSRGGRQGAYTFMMRRPLRRALKRPKTTPLLPPPTTTTMTTCSNRDDRRRRRRRRGRRKARSAPRRPQWRRHRQRRRRTTTRTRDPLSLRRERCDIHCLHALHTAHGVTMFSCFYFENQIKKRAKKHAEKAVAMTTPAKAATNDEDDGIHCHFNAKGVILFDVCMLFHTCACFSMLLPSNFPRFVYYGNQVKKTGKKLTTSTNRQSLGRER